MDILVLDDDPYFSELAHQLFSGEGYRVEKHDSGAGAIETRV